MAKVRELITYDDVGTSIGIHRRAVKFLLGPIQDYCMRQGLPPLTIIVVLKGGDKPGSGFIAWDVGDLARGRAAVYDWDWQREPNPFAYASDGATESTLAAELVRAPSKADEVYTRVKIRGIAQRIFRRALLEAYERSCAFCGLTFEEALEGAHIIDWEKASKDERMAPSNGILLCSTHHKLFDAGFMTVTKSFKIAYSDHQAELGPYSPSDRRTSIDLHGKAVSLPADKKLQPSTISLAYHHRKHDWEELLG